MYSVSRVLIPPTVADNYISLKFYINNKTLCLYAINSETCIITADFYCLFKQLHIYTILYSLKDNMDNVYTIYYATHMFHNIILVN